MKEDKGLRVIISRDVIFDESTMPCRMLSVAGTGDKADQLKRSNEFQLEVEPTKVEPDFDDHGNEVPDDSNQV